MNNRATGATDPSGLQAQPGQFDEGNITITKFNALQGSLDVFAFKDPTNAKEQPLQMSQLMAALKQPVDFSKGFTLNKDQTTALDLLKYKSFFGSVRFGLDVGIKANITKKGADADRYFWVQYVTETGSSTNDAFSQKYKLVSSPLALDGTYPYAAVNRQKKSLELFDIPTYNVTFPIEPTRKNGELTFAPVKESQGFKDFAKDFNKFKGSYELSFISELRRFKPGFGPGHLAIMQIGSIGMNACTPLGIANGIGNAATLNAGFDLATEAVGQVTWGFRISSDLTVTPVNARWVAFKK